MLEPLTQSFIEVEPGYIVVYPEGHCVHWYDPEWGWYVFLGHAMQAVELPLIVPI